MLRQGYGYIKSNPINHNCLSQLCNASSCIFNIYMASAALFCGTGLGLSVAFRKRGKSKLSFAVQFAGFGGIGLTLILFFLFYGNLLSSIN